MHAIEDIHSHDHRFVHNSIRNDLSSRVSI